MSNLIKVDIHCQLLLAFKFEHLRNVFVVIQSHPGFIIKPEKIFFFNKTGLNRKNTQNEILRKYEIRSIFYIWGWKEQGKVQKECKKNI
jgi:hypothetical protein